MGQSSRSSNEEYFTDYEIVASEYYDAVKHPTCANFREASFDLLAHWLQARASSEKRILEVGTGMSVVAPLIHSLHLTPSKIVLSDKSSGMLSHSKAWEEIGVSLMVAPAEALPFPDQSFDIIVSSLGDPYNQPALWQSIHRLLVKGGIFLYTTPSWAWASLFRASAPTERYWSEFMLRTNNKAKLPSWIFPPREQEALFVKYGLSVLERRDIYATQLVSTPLSPKLRVDDDASLSVVTGWLGQRC